MPWARTSTMDHKRLRLLAHRNPPLRLTRRFSKWSGYSHGGRSETVCPLGLEYYDGRVPLGEFYLEDQRHLSLGLYLDLGRIGPR